MAIRFSQIAVKVPVYRPIAVTEMAHGELAVMWREHVVVVAVDGKTTVDLTDFARRRS